MRIILKDEEPVCQPPRRLAFTERQEVNKQIEEWLNEGIIRPSSAEYASPIVMGTANSPSPGFWSDGGRIKGSAPEFSAEALSQKLQHSDKPSIAKIDTGTTRSRHALLSSKS
ncbi:uncharacterized protein TNCV_4923671 [Trichonephila clavipes]|nr:uncharacterized protein TNCV_4923671 [Trichonephila clavipes]